MGFARERRALGGQQQHTDPGDARAAVCWALDGIMMGYWDIHGYTLW